MSALNKDNIYTFLISAVMSESSIKVSAESVLYLISVFDRVHKTSAPKDARLNGIAHIVVKQTTINEAIFRNRFA